MKISTIFTFSLLIMASQVNGQSSIGLIGGLNFTNLKADDFTKTTNRKGVGIGGVIDLRLGRKIELRLIPMFSQKGNRVLESPSGIESKFSLDYFDVPFLLKYTIRETSFAPYFLAGPNLAFMIRSKKSTSKEENLRIDHALKTLDLGLNFGLGVNFPMLNWILFVESRYSIGLLDINEHSTGLPSGTLNVLSDIKTKGLHFLVGVLFRSK